MCGYDLSTPYWRPGPQPRHVLQLGIKPVTLVRRPELNPLSHTSQGELCCLLYWQKKKINIDGSVCVFAEEPVAINLLSQQYTDHRILFIVGKIIPF